MVEGVNQTAATRFLKESTDGDSTTSVGKLFHSMQNVFWPQPGKNWFVCHWLNGNCKIVNIVKLFIYSMSVVYKQ